MFGKRFQLNEQTIPIVEEIGRHMPGGKMGIVCGFKDVDAEVRQEQQIQQAGQREMERRLALQEQLLREESQRAEQDKLITALASDYRGVYYVELDKDEGVCYQVHSGLERGFRVGEHFRFSQDISDYGRRYVSGEYLEEFMNFIRPDAKAIPIIALTANAFDEDVQRSMQAGLNAHLSKPVEPNALFDTLESLIGARLAGREQG